VFCFIGKVHFFNAAEGYEPTEHWGSLSGLKLESLYISGLLEDEKNLPNLFCQET
jgi:hypothetical protein